MATEAHTVQECTIFESFANGKRLEEPLPAAQECTIDLFHTPEARAAFMRMQAALQDLLVDVEAYIGPQWDGHINKKVRACREALKAADDAVPF